MNIKPLQSELIDYLKQHRLEKKFAKATRLFEQDISHPSLKVEVEIISITNHCR